MKILVIKSVAFGGSPQSDTHYTITANTTYADRFLRHVRDEEGYCRACGENCRSCRSGYGLDFSKNIAGIVEVPAVLPVMVDDPGEYVPAEVPDHDVLVAISVHEEVLHAFISKHPVARGVVVPVEESHWITPYGKRSISELCSEKGVEVAFPKPFCSFDPESGVLRDFKAEFRVGKPKIDFAVKSGVIERTTVRCSAPCGATYFTARSLERRSIDEDLQFVIDSALSSYPCTAGRDVDREFNDSITHQAVKLQRVVLNPLETYCIKK